VAAAKTRGCIRKLRLPQRCDKNKFHATRN
jgi:hypothetical protein